VDSQSFIYFFLHHQILNTVSCFLPAPGLPLVFLLLLFLLSQEVPILPLIADIPKPVIVFLAGRDNESSLQ